MGRTIAPRKIAIIKPSALGDIAHAVPVLSGLRDLYPHSHITWIVNSAFEPLLHGHPDLNATLPFDRSVYRKNPIRGLFYSHQLATTLRQARFDLVIDLQGLLRTGIMTAATGAPVRIGFATAREGSRNFYTHRIVVPDADRIHAVDRYWRVIEALCDRPLTRRFLLPTDPQALAEVDVAFAALPRPLLAVAPGARWLTKRWPIRAFAELLNRAQRRYGGTVILLGATDDKPLSRDLHGQLHGAVSDLTGRTGIAKMVAVLHRCAVMLSNDTGPLHVAAALGVPCVAAHLCTKVALHGPYVVSPLSAGVATVVPCAGSYTRQCPHGLICMTDLTADRLWPALERVLQSWQQQHDH